MLFAKNSPCGTCVLSKVAVYLVWKIIVAQLMQNRFNYFYNYKYQIIKLARLDIHVRIQEAGDRGSGPPPPSKNLGFLSNTGLNRLKITDFQASIQ